MKCLYDNCIILHQKVAMAILYTERRHQLNTTTLLGPLAIFSYFILVAIIIYL